MATTLDPGEVTATAALAARPDWEVLGRFAEAMSAFAPAVADARREAQAIYENYYPMPAP